MASLLVERVVGAMVEFNLVEFVSVSGSERGFWSRCKARRAIQVGASVANVQWSNVQWSNVSGQTFGDVSE